MHDLFLKAFISFFITANPLGAAAMFLGLMSYAPAREVRATALKAVLVAGGTLLAFALFGEAVLVKFGITLPAFRVAGGVLLFTIAYRMLFGNHAPEIMKDDHRAFTDSKDIAIFPLGIPLIAGPGCISLTIIMMSKADTTIDQVILIAAILCVMLITWLCLRMSRKLQQILGPSGMNLITRILGILLASRAVQIMADGIQGLNLHGAL